MRSRCWKSVPSIHQCDLGTVVAGSLHPHFRTCRLAFLVFFFVSVCSISPPLQRRIYALETQYIQPRMCSLISACRESLQMVKHLVVSRGEKFKWMEVEVCVDFGIWNESWGRRLDGVFILRHVKLLFAENWLPWETKQNGKCINCSALIFKMHILFSHPLAFSLNTTIVSIECRAVTVLYWVSLQYILFSTSFNAVCCHFCNQTDFNVSFHGITIEEWCFTEEEKRVLEGKAWHFYCRQSWQINDTKMSQHFAKC